MGKAASKLFRPKAVKVLIAGLNSSGKTTLLHRLKSGEVVVTLPSVGIECDTFKVNKAYLQMWDLGGQDRAVRALYRHSYPDTRLIIFVVDTTDSETFSDAQELLFEMESVDDLRDAAFLILANKQDMDGAVSGDKLKELLELQKLSRKRKWLLQECSVVTGVGLEEGIQWAYAALGIGGA